MALGAVAALGCMLAGLAAATAAAAPPADGARRAAAAPAAALAQARPKARPARARTRIRVQPLYPYRRESTPYPTPYPIEYPGPGFVRQCAARLVPEYRPSATVIMPVTRCHWEPG